MIPRHHLGPHTIITYILNVVVLVCAFFFTLALTAEAATYTWDGGGSTNDWSECANWTSNTCPTSADIAQFDATSVKNATVDASFGGTVLGVAVNAGYTGTITQARNLTIGASNFTMASGTWAAGTTTFDLNGSFTQTGGTFFAAAGTTTILVDLTRSGGTMTASTSRAFQFDDTGINQSSVVTCTGELGVTVAVLKDSDGSDFTLGTGCIATTTQMITIGGPDNTQVINGTLNFSATGTRNQGSLTIGAAGVINSNGFTAEFFDTSINQYTTISCTGQLGITISVLKDSDGSDFTLGSGCTATATLLTTIGGPSNDQIINGTLNVTATGTLNQGSLTVGASGVINSNGYKAHFYDSGINQSTTISCTGALGILIEVIKNDDGSDFTLGSGCRATTTDNFQVSGGNSSDLTVNGQLVLNHAATTTVGASVSVGSSGHLVLNANLAVKFNFTVSSGGAVSGTRVIQFFDTSTSQATTLTCTGALNVPIQIDKNDNGGDFILAAGCTATTTGTIVIIGGSATDLTVNGTLTLSSDVNIIGSVTVGASGALIAGGYKIVFFDTGTSNASTLTCTGALNVPIQIDKNDNGSDFTIAAGCAATTTGTVVLTGGTANATDLVVNGTLVITQTATTTVMGGVTVGGGGVLRINADLIVNSAFFLTSGGTFNAQGNRVQFYSVSTSQPGTLTCTGAFPTLVQINKTHNGGDFTIAAGCSATTTGTVIATGGTVTDLFINGTLVIASSATSSVTGAVTIANGGSLSLGANIDVQIDFTLNPSGTLTANGNRVRFYDSGFMASTLTCTGSFPAVISVEKNDNFNNTFTLSSGCTATTTQLFMFGSVVVNGTLSLQSNVDVYINFTLASSASVIANGYTVNFIDNGFEASTLTCTGVFSAPISVVKDNNFNNTFTLSSGCTATTTQLFMFGSVVVNGTLNLLANVDVFLNFTLASSAVVNANGYTVNFIDNGFETSTLTCTGTFQPPITILKDNNTNNIVTVSSGCTATLGGNSTLISAVSILGGLRLNGFNLTTTNTLTVSGTLALIGTETITNPTFGDSSIVEYTGTSTYTGLRWTDYESLAFSGGGTYIATSSLTVEDNFISTGGSSFIMASSAMITFDGDNQTITGTSTFNNLTKNVTATATLTFGAGQEQTLTGNSNVKGTGLAPLFLRSTATGTQYRLRFNGAYDMEYVSLRDANNTGSSTVICFPGCTDVANNTNFSFTGDELSGLRRWDGGGPNTLWSTAANWEFDQVPASTETVVFATTSTKNSTIDTGFGSNIGGIVIAPGYTGTVSASTSLTIAAGGLSIADGTFLAPSSTLTITGGFTQLPAGNFVSNGTTRFSSTAGTTTLVLNGASFNHVVIGATLSSDSLLTAYWKFDEGTSTAVTDSSGNGETGTLQNMENSDWSTATTAPITYLANSAAINFNESNEFAQTDIDIGTAWTVASWFRWPLPAAGGGYNTLVRSNESNEHQILVRTSDNLIGSWNGSSFVSSGYDMDGLSTGWHHLAVKGEGSNTLFFINGVQVGTSTTKSTSNIYAVGNWQGGTQQWGWVDDFRVYGATALSNDEIAALAGIGSNASYITASSSLSANGNFTLGARLNLSTSSCAGGSCSLSVGGNYTNYGTLLAQTGTTTFSGSDAQSVSGMLSGTSSFHHLAVTNTGGTVTFGAPLTTTGTFSMGPNTSAAFLANATHTIARLDLSGGTAGTRAAVRSSVPGTRWTLVPTAVATTSYVSVTDSRNASTSNIQCLDGCADGGNNIGWNFPLGAGALTLLSHPSGQPSNQFTFQNKDDVPLYRFAIATTTESGIIDDLTITLRGVKGIDSSKLADLRLYRDVNNDGALDGGDVAVLGTGIIATQDQTGTISFSTGTTTVTATTSFIVTGDTVAIKNNEFATFILQSGGITAVGASSSLPMSLVGSVSSVQHIRTGNASDGSSGQIGSDAPVGVVRGGGGSGGGQGDLEAGQQLDGENISADPDYSRPTTNGAPHNEWTNAANAYNSDGTYATSNTTNQRQTYGGFGFSIPTTNTIQGIQVKLDGSSTGNSWTFAVSSTFGGYTGQNGTQAVASGGLADGTLSGGTSVWGSNNGTGEYIQADFGSTKYVRTIYLAPIPFSFGSWGVVYTNGMQLQYSTNGTDWTTLTTTSGHVEGQTKAYTAGVDARYIRLYNPSTGYVAAGDFYFDVGVGTIQVGLSWDSGSSVTTLEATPTLSGSDIVYNLGGQTNLWGRSWTPTELNDTFRLRIVAQPSSNTVRLDAIEVRVYHTAGGGGQGGAGEQEL